MSRGEVEETRSTRTADRPVKRTTPPALAPPPSPVSSRSPFSSSSSRVSTPSEPGRLRSASTGAAAAAAPAVGPGLRDRARVLRRAPGGPLPPRLTRPAPCIALLYYSLILMHPPRRLMRHAMHNTIY